jgi:4-amino-4-deoxy-L-arabinose transferase-like glycosyltransferase
LYLGDQILGWPGTADQASYHELATSLLGGRGFSFESDWWPLTVAEAPTAHWSFLYTYFLAAVYGLVGPVPVVARIVQSVVAGILQPLLAYLLGRRLFGEVAGMAAAALTAVYAYFVYYSATLMTEPFFITAILAALYLAIRLVDRSRAADGSATELDKRALALGAVLGAAVLLRQVFLLFVPVLLIWVWWASGRRISTAFLPAVVVTALILPFTLYNYARFGRFVLLNTNAGYAFFWANHPIYGTRFEPILPDEMGSYQGLIPEEIRGLDEAALDQELLKRGLGFVAKDPVRYLRLSLSRISAYFMFWPSRESSTLSNLGRTLSFGLFLPFMAYGMARAWIDRGKGGLNEPIVLLYLFIGVYPAIHLLSWALIRYRLPVDAVLVIFAALGLVDLAQRIGVTRHPAAQPI